jgi:1-acyl-sn-glycerol-3-phosphate acyltransferase
MFSWIAKTLFHLSGWKLAGTVPRHLPRAVWMVAPHATGWDFVVGLGARAATGLWIGFLGKKELFVGPLGWFFRLMGGHPVDRSRHTNLVDAQAEYLRSQPFLHIAITPEGTRADVAELKTGFYHIARLAGVPIVMTGWDYPRKTIFIAEPFVPTGDWEHDRAKIAAFYATLGGVQKTWVRRYLEQSKNANTP